LFADRHILQWDNAPHYARISTAPNHFPDELGKVSETPLSGKPLKDLEKVLSEIEKWLSKAAESPTK